jgi:hemolysin activation/secretion protein
VQLALRAGGARLFGTFPYFDAASLGGSTNRGYRTDRFAGESSVYGSAELRTYITGPKYESIFPVRFGLVGFFDVGRVWQDGEDSRKWHPSGGGGILLKAVGTPIVFRVMVAHSSESTLFYVGSGFRF